MLSDNLFLELVKAASLAPSADNMQPWEFRKQNNNIEIFYAKSRMLPTDVIGMFTWVSIGAAIQNLIVSAAANGLMASLDYCDSQQNNKPVAIVRLSPSAIDKGLFESISRRTTNRSPFEAVALNSEVISNLTEVVHGFNAGIHWTTSTSDLDNMASMDANSSYIRLEHKPLHDELFDILRFTRKDIERTRFGLDFASLEIPSYAVFVARALRNWRIYQIISRLGFGKIVAKNLATRIQNAGALCLITALGRDAVSYMEAGRAMEQLWLAATAKELAIHPYGVLPQYLTKLEVEPEKFLTRHADIIRGHRKPFFSIFSNASKEYPAIVLRVGTANKQSSRSNIRLKLAQIIRDDNDI